MEYKDQIESVTKESMIESLATVFEKPFLACVSGRGVQKVPEYDRLEMFFENLDAKIKASLGL